MKFEMFVKKWRKMTSNCSIRVLQSLATNNTSFRQYILLNMMMTNCFMVLKLMLMMQYDFFILVTFCEDFN